GHYEDLVGQGIKKLAEIGDSGIAPRQDAVRIVRYRRQYEDDRSYIERRSRRLYEKYDKDRNER
ncbi:MAG: hypothetical protein RL326_1490, partial [Pseudomonadota bacterium]